MPAHKKIQPIKQCRVCSNAFSKPPHANRTAWEARETCSKACGARHKNPSGTYTPIVKYCKNNDCREPFLKKRKDTHEFFSRQEYCCISCSKIGKNKGAGNNKWRGDEVTYGALHDWIRDNYGKPMKCDICKTRESRMYHWANVSDKYLRDRDDWKRLCVPCHRKFDKNKKLSPPAI